MDDETDEKCEIKYRNGKDEEKLQLTKYNTNDKT